VTLDDYNPNTDLFQAATDHIFQPSALWFRLDWEKRKGEKGEGRGEEEGSREYPFQASSDEVFQSSGRVEGEGRKGEEKRGEEGDGKGNKWRR
jgi:hypothetical protein